MIVALHSLIYGIGYLIPTGGFYATVLYMSVGEIMPTALFGLIMLITGASLMWAFYSENIKVVTIFSNLQSFVWLFAALVYFFNGFYFLGLGIGLIWSVLSGYVAFAFKNKERTIDNMIRQRMNQK